MKNFLILIYSYVYVFHNINSKVIYHCSAHDGMPEQCMSKWVDFYNNVMYDLWQCPTNKYCQVLERNYGENNSIGVCMYNYKSLHSGDSCKKDSECASLKCENNKCIGFKEGEYCTPKLFQCEDNLACKKSKEILPYGEEKEIFKCNKVGKVNETCEDNDECDVNLVCASNISYNVINLMNKNSIDDITILNSKMNLDEYISSINNSYKICINRASLENGIPTSEPMSCKSGDTIEIELFPNYNETICASKIEVIKDCDKSNTCVVSINIGKYNKTNIYQECIISSLGNPFCPFDQKENAWKNYLEKFYDFNKTNSEKTFFKKQFHFPVYKDTLNEFEISQAFWNYKLWHHYIEADACARDFFFLKNSDNKIKYYYKYLAYIILYLFF